MPVAPWWAEPGWTVAAAKRGLLKWACEYCLRAGVALRASPAAQTFCDHPPYFAYVDEALSCRSCSKPFVFTAKEQLTWYERYKFLVQSRAVRCVACRRAKREHARRQTELSRVMSTLDEKDPAQLANAARALLAVGSHQKAALFLRRAVKATRDAGERADLIRELEGADSARRT